MVMAGLKPKVLKVFLSFLNFMTNQTIPHKLEVGSKQKAIWNRSKYILHMFYLLLDLRC